MRRRFQMLFAFEAGTLHAGATDATAESDHREALRLRRLDQAMAALPRRYKEPLLLTLVAGLTQQQAAEQLKTTTKAIEMRIRRAKKLLSEALSHSDDLSSSGQE